MTQSGSTLATYTYDASGTKIRNTGSDGGWDYIDGISYNNTTSSSGIKFIQTEAGRAIPIGSGTPTGTTSYHYEYNLTDHLGNVRVSFDKDPTTLSAREIQEDEYYAFGLRNPLENSSNNNRYLYNGKEIQTDLTNQYDYGARFYDPVIGSWNTVDPIAEMSKRFSTYTYGNDNPIRFIDPDGMSTEDWLKANGLTENDLTNVYTAPADNNSTEDPPKKKSTTAKGGKNNKPANWQYNIPVWGDSLRAGDDWDAGNYWSWAGDQASGVTTGVFLLEATGEEAAVSLENYVVGLFARRGAFEELSYASEYGFGEYKTLAKLTAGKGLNVHHLIEQRFASLFGEKESDMISIVLTETEHQAFTKAWRAQIGYITNKKALINTANATKIQIENAARIIYQKYPQILSKLGL